jgi:glutamyl/glutaminyl-tRNA synthetase
VQELRDAGYLPEAVRNYVSLLGWGYDESTTFMSTNELIDRFDLSRVSKNPAVFDEQKLRWMNGRYLRELAPDDLRARLEALSGREVPPEAVAISQEKMQTLADFWPLAGFLVERPAQYDEKAWSKVMSDGAPERLRSARSALEAVPEPFESEQIEEALRRVVEQLEVKPREIFQPIRVALTGTTVSPGIFESVAALGREETLARIDAALARAGAAAS